MATVLAISGFVIALTGLVLPGYSLARSLRIKNCWLVSFPFSALILVEGIIFFTILQVPIRFSSMAVALGAWTALNCLLANLRKSHCPPGLPHDGNNHLTHLLQFCCIGLALIVVMAVAFRTTMYPLSGYDTFFRWDALARQMLQYESLQHYPPVSAADYSIYLIPDGIPPLVASVYWWLYASIGKPLMEATSIAVVLQLVSCLGLTFYAAYHAFGTRAAYFALLALSTSTLFINGLAMGQETGYTALSVAGQFCFAWAAVRKPRVSFVVAAALFAALGAMARDYGPALALSGFLVLAWHGQTRRFLWLFTAIVVMVSLPWYLRVWALTGNPLFPHAIPGGFPTNAVFKAIQNSYHEVISFYQYNIRQWMSHAGILIAGAPLVLLGGIAYGSVRWRESAPMLITAAFVTLLWLLSMGETAGGVVYSMRVLTPAFVALSLVAGAAGAFLYEQKSRFGSVSRAMAGVAVAACALYAGVFAASHPFSPKYFTSAVTYCYSGTPEMCLNTLALTDKLLNSSLPATGVLTSNAYLATILQGTARYRPVMVWSPEVTFVFDPKLTSPEITRRLIEKNIRIVSLQDDSVNNPYLLQFSLYKDIYQDMTTDKSSLVAVEGNEAFYLLSPLK